MKDEPIRILIGRDLEEKHLELIRSVDPRIEIDIAKDQNDRDKKIRDAEILFTHRPKIDVKDAPNLKWIQFMWEGVDHLLMEGYDYPGIILTNSSGVHSVSIAEYVFTYILHITKKVEMYRRYEMQSKWLGWWDQPLVKNLQGSTIGIVGYGRIGRAIGKIANGFGMRIIACKRDPEKRRHTGFEIPGCCDMEGILPERFYGPGQITEMLPQCDFVVISLPLTEDTIHFMGGREFESMKKDSVLINIGRGRLVDQEALIAALKNGEFAGAGLDVFDEEPLPRESPLWTMDNVVVTPHSSTGGNWETDAVVALFVENIQRYIHGDDLLNVIDKEAGY